MANLSLIASGWASYLIGSADTRERMAKRLAVCDQCPNKEQVSPLTGLVLNLIGNNEKNLFRCGLCKCPLAGLTAAADSKCKIGNW